jgi:hypothetical protein
MQGMFGKNCSVWIAIQLLCKNNAIVYANSQEKGHQLHFEWLKLVVELPLQLILEGVTRERVFFVEALKLESIICVSEVGQVNLSTLFHHL